MKPETDPFIINFCNMHKVDSNQFDELCYHVKKHYQSLNNLPENKPLYKDSGLWQMRTDDMKDVIIQQSVNETDSDFITRCISINIEEKRGTLEKHQIIDELCKPYGGFADVITRYGATFVSQLWLKSMDLYAEQSRQADVSGSLQIPPLSDDMEDKMFKETTGNDR